MRLSEIIKEGGWQDTATQGTVITPAVVKKALGSIKQFANDFNSFLEKKGLPPVKVGVPLGSSTYYEVDPEDAEYGDIDMQILVQPVKETQGLTASQEKSFWVNLAHEFVQNVRPSYIHSGSTPEHIIVHAGPGRWVQVDLLFFRQDLENWGRYRYTPEQGIKGAVLGSLHSTLGELLTLSIQDHGVLYKEQNGVRLPYSKTRKNFTIHTISTDIARYVLDIFKDEYQIQAGRDLKTAKIDSMLMKNPGLNLNKVNVIDMVNSIKGLARSFAMNNMYGRGNLKHIANYDDFINKFLACYEGKLRKNIDHPKRDKAQTPQAIAHAEKDIKALKKGLKMVQDLFKS